MAKPKQSPAKAFGTGSKIIRKPGGAKASMAKAAQPQVKKMSQLLKAGKAKKG
jgi:hypothetical protein